MPETTIIPLNVVTPSGTKTRTFAPSNASLAELRKILVEDAIIKPHVKFHVDGIIIGATAELHMKWTEVIREIHVCEDASLGSRGAPCIPVDSQHAEHSVTYPSPTQTPPPDDTTNKRLEQSQKPFDYPVISSAQAFQKACDARAGSKEESEDCTESCSITPKPCLLPTVSDCPDAPCEGHSSNTCGQPSSNSQACFTGGDDSDNCDSPVASEPCLPPAVPESPCDPPDECDTKCLDQPCSIKGQDCVPQMACGNNESSSFHSVCRDNQDTDRQELEDCPNKGCFDDATDSSQRDDDCCSNEGNKEDLSSCTDRSSESKQTGFKYRPLRLSSDSTLMYGEFNFGKPRTPRTSGFGRTSLSGALSDQRTPSRPASAVRSNFNLSLSSGRSDEVSRLEGQHTQDRTYSLEQSYEIGGTPSHFESPAKDEALAGTICTPRSEDRSLPKDFTQRLRSGTIRGTEAPSVAFSAPVNVGGVAHARLNLSSTSSGEIERDDAFSSTVSIISHTDVLWRQRLDIVNTVKTVMQAGCADSNRFAAAFGGLQIDASLFQGAALSANGPRLGSFEAVQPANGDIESANEDTPIEGGAVSDDLDQCTSPSISSTSVGLNTGFILSDDEEHSTSGNCTESTRPSATSIESLVSPLAKVPLYRLYAATFPDHFYTTNAAERDACAAYGYILESTAAQILASPSPEGCSVPFFRIYRNKDHFYTTDVAEKERVVGWAGTRDEGIAGYVYAERCVGTVPLYRLYNPRSDDHFYTTSAPERETCVQSGQWNDEGVACYVYP